VSSDPRKAALNVLNTLEKGQQTLDRILEDVTDPKDFVRRDRALLNALVYGVLRWRGRLDYIISFFSTKRLENFDPSVLNILRLGLFQIIYLNRIPNSAAVNTSVELTKSDVAPWAAGFVNALLRNAAENYHTAPFPDREKNPVCALATEKSFPEWLIKRWINRFGLKTVEELCNAINSIPPITVRTNLLKTSRQKLMQSLAGHVEKIEPTRYVPDGIHFFNPKTNIAQIDAFKSGWFQVQDEAAQLVSLLLDPQPGDTVLDACAGLGGKTGHIAQQMNNHGKIIAMDKDRIKLSRLETEMARLGVSIVSTRLHNLDDAPNPQEFGHIDRILLDAPCSGLGVLRRNPDIKWNASKKDWQRYAQRQVRFLCHLAPLVNVSGILVYAVCSVEPEENEAVIEAFLSKNPGFVLDQDTGKLPKEVYSQAGFKNFLKTYPHLKHMDGFFMARLRRLN
jgi:16S rRNA (cytosine967-C5)-methyltransferase